MELCEAHGRGASTTASGVVVAGQDRSATARNHECASAGSLILLCSECRLYCRRVSKTSCNGDFTAVAVPLRLSTGCAIERSCNGVPTRRALRQSRGGATATPGPERRSPGRGSIPGFPARRAIGFGSRLCWPLGMRPRSSHAGDGGYAGRDEENARQHLHLRRFPPAMASPPARTPSSSSRPARRSMSYRAARLPPPSRSV